MLSCRVMTWSARSRSRLALAWAKAARRVSCWPGGRRVAGAQEVAGAGVRDVQRVVRSLRGGAGVAKHVWGVRAVRSLHVGWACGVGGGRGVPLRLRQLVLGDGDGLRLAPGGGGALELRLDRVDLHRALRICRVEVTHGVLGRLLGRNLLLVPQALLLLLDARAVGEAQVLAQELLAA